MPPGSSGPSVLVVGAGLLGRSAAYYLAHGSAQVRLIDADADPSPTSRASLGVLTHANGRDDPFGNFYRAGHALHGELAPQLEEETGIDVGWGAVGGLDLVISEEDESEAQELLEYNRSRGCPAEWLEHGAVRELEPRVAAGVIGAVHFPGDHRVDPPALAAALLEGACRAGARFDAGTALVAIGERSDRQVQTRLRRLQEEEEASFDFAVLAAGSWSGELARMADSQLAVRPIRGQHIRCRGGELNHILRHRGCHAVPVGEEIAVGATVEDVGYDLGTTRPEAARLGAALETMLEGEVSIVGQRAGLRPKPRKGRPIIGPLPGHDRIMVATGHYKSGVLMGPITGQVVARWILAGTPSLDMNCFSVQR